jgi:phosphohistidine phosphatase
MNLYFLRHASAGVRRPNPVVDAKRPLDKEGKRFTLQLAHVLNVMNLQFDLIVSSPLKRSLQTASLVGIETAYERPVQRADALAPTGSLAAFRALLADLPQVENVLIVGHNPNLTTFLGALISGRGDVAGRSDAVNRVAGIRLRKGALARVDTERKPPTLMWLLDPRIVRALYISSTKSSRRKTSKK